MKVAAASGRKTVGADFLTGAILVPDGSHPGRKGGLRLRPRLGSSLSVCCPGSLRRGLAAFSDPGGTASGRLDAGG